MLTKLHPNTKDITGKRFERLIVQGAVCHVRDRLGRSHLIWRCLCDCGAIVETRAANLLHGDTLSCGCYVRDKVVARNLKHGGSTGGKWTPEYRTWHNVRQRCLNPSNSKFQYYGGRGITICDEWRDDFSAFLAHVGTRPSDIHSLDRIDNNVGYQPGNVRWATRLEQAANKRNNYMITVNGETMHMNAWCRRTGIDQRKLSDRMKRGWPPELAIDPAAKFRMKR